jgi:hypothetical protein
LASVVVGSGVVPNVVVGHGNCVVPGVVSGVVPGVVRSVVPGVVRSVVPGVVRSVVPGVVRSVVPAVVASVVPGVVRGGGEAAAWTGATMELMRGLDHLLGRTRVVTVPPMMTFRTCLRS